MEETCTDSLALLRTCFPSHQIRRMGACILGTLRFRLLRFPRDHHPAPSRAQSLGLCGSGVSQAFQHEEALNPQPTAAPCPLRGVDAGQSKG